MGGKGKGGREERGEGRKGRGDGKGKGRREEGGIVAAEQAFPRTQHIKYPSNLPVREPEVSVLIEVGEVPHDERSNGILVNPLST
jgi:hypothetical protein